MHIFMQTRTSVENVVFASAVSYRAVINIDDHTIHTKNMYKLLKHEYFYHNQSFKYNY